MGFILKRQICQRKGRLEILKVKIYGVEIIKFPSLSDKVFCLLAINIYCFECYLFFIKISDLSPRDTRIWKTCVIQIRPETELTKQQI